MNSAAIEFELPDGADASAPPEARGLTRDGVRLAVATPAGVAHTTAAALPDHLHPGDLVVVNTSATLPAALEVTRHGPGQASVAGAPRPLRGDTPVAGSQAHPRGYSTSSTRRRSRSARPAGLGRFGLHVSTELDDGSWVVELRQADLTGPAVPEVDDVLRLPGGVRLRVLAPHPEGQRRLWRASVLPAVDRVAYLAEHGRPIRYSYVDGEWPIDELQNVYADRPGSAEMPSAGRPLSERTLVRLIPRGVAVAPIELHTGVSSQESHEPPQPELFTVPAATARLVESTRAAGRRVVAVGTTVVRALESAAPAGRVVPTTGWTDLVLGPHRPARVVRGLLTGLHEPEASHLDLLQAVAGRDLVADAYAAVTAPDGPRYLWHEFGDSMLLLP